MMPMMPIMKFILMKFIFAVIFVALFSCKDEIKPVTQLQKPHWVKDISVLLAEPERWYGYTPEERFVLYHNVRKFYQNSESQDDSSQMISPELQQLDDIFLSLINTNPEEPYASYYLYNVAQNYIKRGEDTMGFWLLRSMYQKFPDLQLPRYSSIHYLILTTLGRMEKDPDDLIELIPDILNHNTLNFSLTEDNRIAEEGRGTWIYRLGKAYEKKL